MSARPGTHSHAPRHSPWYRFQNAVRNAQNRNPESIIAAGKVRIHAIPKLRTVLHCRPERFAAMVPATPDDSTWVVLTGSPNQSAAPMVAIAVISAAAP